MTSYRCINGDVPWHFAVRSPRGEGRSAKRHYDTMSLADLAAMRPMIDQWAAPDCCLFMWAIDPMIPQALDLIEAWGFTYKTVAFYWVKLNSKSPGYFTGMGYWTRANPEMCLLATRGRPRRLAKDVRRLIVAPRREHSRKPAEFYQRVERLVAGPYLDVFARETRPGWDSWGNETTKFSIAA